MPPGGPAIQRIVHVSITHPSVDSPFPYFRGKALVERALAESERLLRHPPAGHPLRR